MSFRILSLPEELVLHTFAHLNRLDDLHNVMLTCKNFKRIADDLPAEAISQIALRTGDFLPGLRPHRHMLLLAAAPRLAHWARESDSNREQSKSAMPGGMDILVSFALKVAPITLDDIRSIWSWKQDTLNPLSKRLDVLCGSESQSDPLTVCEDPELSLLSWAIYGELFSMEPWLMGSSQCEPLDCVSRFLYMAYCVPDVNCFTYLALDEPAWFKEMPHGGDKFQQLSLQCATESGGGLSLGDFKHAIKSLTDIRTSEKHLVDISTSKDRALVFAEIVRGTGRKSLDVLQAASNDSSYSLEREAALTQWLRDMWDAAARLDAQSGETNLLSRFNSNDPWLKPHLSSMQLDARYTLWANLQQSLRLDSHDGENALNDVIKSYAGGRLED